MAQLVACPDCQKHLQVPDNLLGKKVQCPECKSTFTAQTPDEEEARTATSARPMPSSNVPARMPAWDKKSSRDDDDDDDDEYRPRRRRAVRGYHAPHRGGMILAFGLLGFVFLPFGIIAWVMGNSDLAEIRAGRMDPDGEGTTQAGRILGIISVVLALVGILLLFGYFGCIFMIVIFAVAGAAGQKGAPKRRN